MNILFLNHTAASSGAELALLRLIEGLRAEHTVALACPDDGPLSDQAYVAGIRRFSVPAFHLRLATSSQRPAPVCDLTCHTAHLDCVQARFLYAY